MSGSQELANVLVSSMEKILDAKDTIGEVSTQDGVTIIPVVSYGFGFGVGEGGGIGEHTSRPDGFGGGGGGGVKPVAVVVVSDGTAQVARLDAKGGSGGSVLEKIGDVVEKVMDRKSEKED